MKPGTKNLYPTTLGITGEVFKNQKIVYGYVKQLGNFIPGLDNQSKYIKEVNTICVVPIFGHNSESEENNLIGIAQFFNKIKGHITEHDIVSLFLIFS